MKDEKDFKKVFKSSVKRHKGFALSLAAPMLVGIPDLYVAMPGYAPVLLEAKWLGEIKRDSFFRKIPFTGLQTHWLEEVNNVSKNCALGLIGMIYQNRIHCILLNVGTPLFYQLNRTFKTESPYVLYDMTSKSFNLTELFNQSNIPLMSNLKTKERFISIYASI